MTSEQARKVTPGLASRRSATVSASGESLPRYEFSPHNCFACGTLNTHGLGLVLHVEQGHSWTELTLERAFEGWEGIAHGGILCTILDEVMAWALVGADNWGVTARMSVEFRRPVPIGRRIRADGSVSTLRRRVVATTARLVDSETGELLATATGTYVAASGERKRALQERYGFRITGADTSGRSDPPESGDIDSGVTAEAAALGRAGARA